jgi:hypothetical protein
MTAYILWYAALVAVALLVAGVTAIAERLDK